MGRLHARGPFPFVLFCTHLFLTPSGIMPDMATKKKHRQKVPPILAAVVRPVSIRLSRMEDLLIEMRAEQDVKLKKINKLQQQFEELTEAAKRRLSPSS